MTSYSHTTSSRGDRIPYASRSAWFCAAAVGIALGAAGSALVRPAPAAAELAMPVSAGPVAIVDGREVGWDELGPLMSEVAGAAVLEEVVLDDVLRKATAQDGITITDAEMQRERALFIDTMVTGAGASRDQAETLLKSVRKSRGLGEARFRALLTRNASLRALVNKRSPVKITDEDIEQAHRIKYGPQRKARLLLAPSERDALAAIDRIKRAGGGAGAFSDAAMDLSSDNASRTRGGLLGWVRTADPVYPAAIRRALESLDAGKMSGPVAVDQGYAVLMVEEVRAGSGPSLGEAKEQLRSEVRLVRERSAMDRMARDFLSTSRVTVFDRSLGEAWEQRENAAPPPPGGSGR